ncbi:hypothetical protein [Pigmentiphaga sp. NML030171]|uniref:hypothetical protein n=1 Tax=Pigmentiphaga sp. NML030171 TaxID=2008676 RepID=UPI001124DAFB|nr:hypothetical protein [Pigmentiphaga sp. NML030171]
MILVSTMLPAASNVATPAVLALSAGLGFVGLWLATRASIQLALACIPSPATALLQLGPSDNEAKRQALLDAVLLYIGGTAILAFTITLGTVVFLEVLSLSSAVLLSLYSLVFAASGNCSVLVRVHQRGDVLLRISIVDALLNVAALLAAYYALQFFLSVMVVKELLRIALCMAVIPKRFRFSFPIKKITGIGGPQILRNFLQVASQHGDRIVMPTAFGLAASGLSGIGSVLGAALSMLSSSAYIWALPKVLAADHIAENWVVDEWARLNYVIGWLAVCCSIVAPFLPHVKGIETVGMGLAYASVMGVSFLGLVSSRTFAVSSRSVLLHGSGLCIAWLTLIGAAAAGVSQPISMALSISVLLLIVCIVYRQLLRWKRLLGSALVLLSAVWTVAGSSLLPDSVLYLVWMIVLDAGLFISISYQLMRRKLR